MITRHHMTLALMCAFIACSSFYLSSPLLVVMVALGTCTGAIVPDIQMSRPKRLTSLTLAWLIVQFPRRVCAPLLSRMVARAGYPVRDISDKRLTHSLPGVLFIFAFSCVLLYFPVYLANRLFAGYVFVFLCGVLLGMGLHLVEDVCTRKGIFPFFPFSKWEISGSIRPCDRTDPRIARYHVQHCTVLIVLFWLESTGILAPAYFLPLSIAGIAACLCAMVYLSEVSIRRDSGYVSIPGVPMPVKSS